MKPAQDHARNKRQAVSKLSSNPSEVAYPTQKQINSGLLRPIKERVGERDHSLSNDGASSSTLR